MGWVVERIVHDLGRRWDSPVALAALRIIFTVNAISLAALDTSRLVVVLAAITGLGTIATFFNCPPVPLGSAFADLYEW